ncbi:CHAT domain-containing protein [Planktothricoides raciborskii]|uniref:Tetratricopeptide repeat protein n=1 Tax=Planktothricoides raciborskii FACHB-1370 TaxID=2949576 RepID=A0ABR8ELN9_9CYAN|nr:CHAT domain-containing tetratricopeptide repeat protein [Planktothricoides raciborskii]MBD2547826.1 tetratricopeptide repeat protein [Planktothricoides raciborskii FACHB-1370]MBD2586264.1 tetratricopeptide repeat protein [Planktothricoides raciborskii FACHB-1261]
MAKGFGRKEPQAVTKRQKAYMKLIGDLLTCRRGQEPKILMAHQHLIDDGLLAHMTIAAMALGKRGDRESAKLLMNIATVLAEAIGLGRNADGGTKPTRKVSPTSNSKEFQEFLLQMMQAMMIGNRNPNATHPILAAYLAQDRNFIQRFLDWAIAEFSDTKPENSLILAEVMRILGSAIAEFPLGDRAENIETAITCYQVALKVINRDRDGLAQQLWVDVQNVLGMVYSMRIRGDQAENLEAGIAAFEAALQGLDREPSPELWGQIQNNLGNAYRDRIWGDKSENIERAIAARKAALQVRTRQALPEKWAMVQMNLAVDYRQRIEGDKAENLELALAANQAALQVYTRQEFPHDWADVHINLGNVYHDRIRGDKSENLDLAISAFQAALQVYTRNHYPEKWAMAQMNLGNLYRVRGQIAEAVACYRSALEIFTPTAYPEQCLTVGINIGYMAFDAGLWSEAIEGYGVAIKAVEQQLLMAASEARRQEIKTECQHIYAKIVQACVNNGQPEKAKEYAQLSGSVRLLQQLETNNFDDNDEVIDFIVQLLWHIGETEHETEVYPLLEANLDKLDDNFIRCLQLLGKYIQSQVKPEKIAEFHQLFKPNVPSTLEPEVRPTELMMMAGIMPVFNDMMLAFPLGNRATNIEIAIAGYEAIIPVFTAVPEEWAIFQNYLAIAYKRRIYGDRRSNIEKAIACYRNALQVFTPKSSPAIWGDFQNNLAIAYSERLEGDRAQNIEQAIALANEILVVCTRDAFPEQWADSQTNLGKFYRDRVSGDPAENLEISIRCYQDALQIFTREAFPQNWGRIQEGLGLSYSNRIKGDRAENAELAIDYFQAALQVLDREAFPIDWVRLQCNLGNGYRRRILGDLSENLELEIQCYEAAREVATLETMPEQWALVQINLGLAYSDRRKGNQESNLNAAIRCYKAALQVWVRRAYPQQWATLHNNLGLLYGRLGMPEQEIKYLQASLEVCTREAYPQDWANTQYNLGLAYHRLEQISPAIDCFRLSLEIFTPSASPIDCLTSARELGNLTFDLERWSEAIEGYTQAIEAVETSRTWATSESRRQQILRDAIDIYPKMVQACINTGQLDKAIETVERSRSKRLVDLMASNDLYSGGEIPPQVEEYLQQYENLQQQIDRQRSQNNSQGDSSRRSRAAWQAYNEAIAALESQKQFVWEQLRRLDPVLAGQIQVEAPKLSSIQQLLNQPTTAILSFYTTDSDTHIFVIQQNQISLHTCTGQGFATLQNWIFANWLQPYINDKDQWKNQINSVLTELAQRLQLDELIAQHLTDIDELIIVPHLELHQIPFAALPVAENQFLTDKFLIRYIPSCQVLELCQKRPPVGENLIYGTVEDATGDLPCASFEGEQIAQLHNISDERRLKGSTQATVSNYRQLIKQVQGMLSSHHAHSRLDRPLESQLKLGDGSITLGQLMTPGWRLPHLSDVFLSCCETGLGVTEITDDILTLSTGFLCAGARSAVSTLWSVDDFATALFSIFYHRYRQQGFHRPEALRRSQVELRTLTGDTLAATYQPKITHFLEKSLKYAYATRKEAKTERDRHPQDSSDFQQWDLEFKSRTKMCDRIGNTIKHLKFLCCESLPFSHPFYWAAFICSGLQ